ncbi:MAG: 4Fe-4S binding protein [Desulfobacterales bacterium]
MFSMSPNVLRNLVTRKATRRYPREVRTPFERVRGDLQRQAGKCTYCGICAAKCPSRCIRVEKRTAAWIHDPTACVFCGICVEACPEECLHTTEKHRPPFAAKDAPVPEGFES